MGIRKVMSCLRPGHGASQVEAEVGKPRVNYLEAITQRVHFDYLHKKQSGESSALLLHCICLQTKQTGSATER